MPKQWVKQQLRKDRLAQYSEQIILWVKKNRENATIGIFVLAGVIAIGIYVVRAKIQEINLSRIELIQAVEMYYAGMTDDAMSLLDKVVAKNKRATKPMALYYRGNILLRENKLEEAIAVFNTLIHTYRTKPYIQEIMAQLGIALQNKKEYQKAIDAYNELLKSYPKTYRKPEILYYMAICYKRIGNEEGKLNAIQRIDSEFPSTIWKEKSDRLVEPESAD